MLLFDCDGTLWRTDDDDYISSLVSPFEKVSPESIMRKNDQKIFYLNQALVKKIGSYFRKGLILGVVSDNLPGPVTTALKLFGLDKFFEPGAINIRLWKGHCNKGEMILEILGGEKFHGLFPGEVTLVDDKDYKEELGEIGVKFVRVNKMVRY